MNGGSRKRVISVPVAKPHAAQTTIAKTLAAIIPIAEASRLRTHRESSMPRGRRQAPSNCQREIDTAGGDDQRHADRDKCDDRNLTQDVV